MLIRLALVAVALAAMSSPAHAQQETKLDNHALATMLDDARKTHDVPAMGVAIVTSAGAKHLVVRGVRKRGDKVATTNDDLFHLGSDTKAMTATLVAVLVGKKLLSYDRTLAETFPEMKLPAAFGAIALTQLLTHRAGLPVNLEWGAIPLKGGVVKGRETAVRRLAAGKLSSKPGEKFVYGNSAYVAAAAMAERVAKKPWEDLLVEHVTKPLKMTSVGIGPAGTRGKVDQPWGHDEKGKPIDPTPGSDNPAVLGPAGRVHCSLGDWAKFVAEQLKGAKGQGTLLDAAAYKTLHSAAKGEDYTPGGWLVSRINRWHSLTHDGSNTRNYVTAWLVPKADVAVLVVCNQGGAAGRKATHEVRDAVLMKLGL